MSEKVKTQEEKAHEELIEHRKTVQAVDKIKKLQRDRNKSINKSRFDIMVSNLIGLVQEKQKGKLIIPKKIDFNNLQDEFKKEINSYLIEAYEDDMIGD